jgi:hypothetical protein
VSWLRTTALFTLLLFAATVAAGFVFGIVNRAIGLEHAWGTLDAGAVMRVIITLAVALGVFSVLAKKHSREYYSIGAGVVIVTAILSTVSAFYLAPPAARGAHNWGALLVWPLLFNITALVVAGQIWRLRNSSSNTSPERTRER